MSTYLAATKGMERTLRSKLLLGLDNFILHIPDLEHPIEVSIDCDALGIRVHWIDKEMGFLIRRK